MQKYLEFEVVHENGQPLFFYWYICILKIKSLENEIS